MQVMFPTDARYIVVHFGVMDMGFLRFNGWIFYGLESQRDVRMQHIET